MIQQIPHSCNSLSQRAHRVQLHMAQLGMHRRQAGLLGPANVSSLRHGGEGALNTVTQNNFKPAHDPHFAPPQFQVQVLLP